MDYFGTLLAEFQTRHAAMFAFSNKQVAEQFQEWGLDTPKFPLTGWSSIGAGLIVRTDVRDEFLTRLESSRSAHLETLPVVTVKPLHLDYWDRWNYVVTATESDTVVIGQVLVDVSLSDKCEAPELHSVTNDGEPICAVNARIVFTS